MKLFYLTLDRWDETLMTIVKFCYACKKIDNDHPLEKKMDCQWKTFIKLLLVD